MDVRFRIQDEEAGWIDGLIFFVAGVFLMEFWAAFLILVTGD